MSFFSTTPHNTITSTGTSTKIADEAPSKSGFAVPPASLSVDDHEKEKDGEGEALNWVRGTKVHALQHIKALDPYSHEYVNLPPHIKGEVVNLRDQSKVPRNHIAVMLNTVDSGDGRIVLIEADSKTLVKDGLFSHL